jgi:hypothetical protein
VQSRAQDGVKKVFQDDTGKVLHRLKSMAVSSTKRFDDLNNEMRSRYGMVRPPSAYL